MPKTYNHSPVKSSIKATTIIERLNNKEKKIKKKINNMSVVNFVEEEKKQQRHVNNLNPKAIAKMYGKVNLAGCKLFAGNFINFGYWPTTLQKATISLAERIESEKNLYRIALKKIKISHTDTLLEVACGKGAGSRLILSEFKPQLICGIDFSSDQIKRAQEINEEFIKHGRIFFQVGAAEKIPFMDSSFDKLISIEALQHFSNIDLFLQEAYRVMKSKGKICLATFFSKSPKANQELSLLIQTVPGGLDAMYVIDDFLLSMKHVGFENINVESIGQHVWHGWDKWIGQTEFKNTWNRNWIKAYKHNLLDYFIITAEKN